MPIVVTDDQGTTQEICPAACYDGLFDPDNMSQTQIDAICNLFNCGPLDVDALATALFLLCDQLDDFCMPSGVLADGDVVQACVDGGVVGLVYEEPEPFLDFYERDAFVTGGGACVQLTGSTSAANPVIFRSRNNQIINGSASVNPVNPGLVTAVVNNSSSIYPTLAKVTMTGLANRSLGNSGVGVGMTFILSRTLNEPVPIAPVIGGSTQTYRWNPENVALVQPQPYNNFDQDGAGDSTRRNYGAVESAPMVYNVVLPPAGSATLYGQWFAYLAPIGTSTTSSFGTLILHGTMQISVEYFINGKLTNQEVV